MVLVVVLLLLHSAPENVAHRFESSLGDRRVDLSTGREPHLLPPLHIRRSCDSIVARSDRRLDLTLRSIDRSPRPLLLLPPSCRILLLLLRLVRRRDLIRPVPHTLTHSLTITQSLPHSLTHAREYTCTQYRATSLTSDQSDPPLPRSPPIPVHSLLSDPHVSVDPVAPLRRLPCRADVSSKNLVDSPIAIRVDPAAAAAAA